MTNEIFSEIDAMGPELTALRRDFHQHPETGWFEVRTSSIIAGVLTNLGYEVLVGREVCAEDSRMGLPSLAELKSQYQRALEQGADKRFAPAMQNGFTGVVGLLHCGDGPVVALRFDIDALPLSEDTEQIHRPAAEGFASINAGMMHACGHDGHIAIGIGVAKALVKLKNQLHGTVKLVFQPAEEGVRGARSIVEKGHLDGVDYLLAAHMGGDADTAPGQLLLDSGGTLATTKFDAVFQGRSAHAGEAPQEGHNAMLAAATAILNLHGIPRYGGAATQVNVGTISGGTGRNVVCSSVRLEAEVRGSTSEANRYMEEYAVRVLENAARMHGCTVEVQKKGAAESIENSPAFSERFLQVCRKQGITVQDCREKSFEVSEDFSWMARRVQEQSGQSCYFHVLSRCAAGLHQSRFDFDESALPAGVKAFTAIVCDLMKKK